MSKRTVVVIGGHRPHRTVLQHAALQGVDIVICADSGFDHAIELGLRPDVVVGDLDSIADPSAPVAFGARILAADTDKDHTDTELALEHALAVGSAEVTVVWGGGDRVDHVLGVFAALAAPALGRLDRLTVLLGPDVVHVVHGGRRLSIDIEIGSTVSLLSLSGTALGVTTTGLRWPLHDDDLHDWRARGVSNVAVDRSVSVRVESGVVAVVVNDEGTERER